jgi:hypothetical protein
MGGICYAKVRMSAKAKLAQIQRILGSREPGVLAMDMIKNVIKGRVKRPCNVVRRRRRRVPRKKSLR